ncbi:hypothetical protein HPB48_008798 [Haemaphysalis longicornis]|uniref:Uncharacterized protein n=1 Tax=Haemaphysalis longicornis TaxID=44386 RepID=A0A9J6GYB2_HAELO|nr:hypothetical protein HPB48_008798 [Haemaphysalis longicornis]
MLLCEIELQLKRMCLRVRPKHGNQGRKTFGKRRPCDARLIAQFCIRCDLSVYSVCLSRAVFCSSRAIKNCPPKNTELLRSSSEPSEMTHRSDLLPSCVADDARLHVSSFSRCGVHFAAGAFRQVRPYKRTRECRDERVRVSPSSRCIVERRRSSQTIHAADVSKPGCSRTSSEQADKRGLGCHGNVAPSPLLLAGPRPRVPASIALPLAPGFQRAAAITASGLGGPHTSVAAFLYTDTTMPTACIGFLSDDASAISDAFSPSRRCRRREFSLPGRNPADVNLADSCARGVGAVCVVFTTARMRRRRLRAPTVLFRSSAVTAGTLGRRGGGDVFIPRCDGGPSWYSCTYLAFIFDEQVWLGLREGLPPLSANSATILRPDMTAIQIEELAECSERDARGALEPQRRQVRQGIENSGRGGSGYIIS